MQQQDKMRKAILRVALKDEKSFTEIYNDNTNEMARYNIKTLHVFFKILFLIGLPYSIIRGPYATRYCYIPRNDIAKALLPLQTGSFSNSNLPMCEHSAIWNGTKLNTPDESIEISFDPKNIEAGQFYPRHCVSKYSTAILVPYRNRPTHLAMFLPYIHIFLRRQELHYRIFLISQDDDKPWNKGKLYNVGAKIVSNLGFKCLILHDIDLFPLHEANIYTCSGQPRHMSANVDKHRYNLMYDFLVGGVLAITTEHYKLVNGYSNKFEMWGGEDDEFSDRIKSENLTIQRFPPEISLYHMITHKQEPINDNRHRIREENYGKHKLDGMSNINVSSIRIVHHPLYTNISVFL